MISRRKHLASCWPAIAALLCSTSPGTAAGVAPDLGAAQSFAVLGASTVTLVGSGPFIFKIGSTLTTASGSSVLVIDGGQTCSGSKVFWAVGSSATLGTGTRFAGNILALISITLTTSVELSGSQVGTRGGNFNYLNHVTGLHVIGPVTDVQVIAINPDGSPKTIRLSGTCDKSGPACSFSVTVEDHGEPGRSNQLGIAVVGAVSEVRSQRIISGGNIQFHK
jgi:ice-binding like protein